MINNARDSRWVSFRMFIIYRLTARRRSAKEFWKVCHMPIECAMYNVHSYMISLWNFLRQLFRIILPFSWINQATFSCLFWHSPQFNSLSITKYTCSWMWFDGQKRKWTFKTHLLPTLNFVVVVASLNVSCYFANKQ